VRTTRWNRPLPVFCGSRREKAAEVTPTASGRREGQEFDAPNGHVKIDPDNLHTYLTPRIAQWLRTDRARSSMPKRSDDPNPLRR